MTDYVIQKATAAKYGVVPSPENIFECRKAILKKLGGDETKVNDIYECDKAILPLVNGGGSANLVEMTQADYDILTEKDPNTIYLITD